MIEARRKTKDQICMAKIEAKAEVQNGKEGFFVNSKY